MAVPTPASARFALGMPSGTVPTKESWLLAHAAFGALVLQTGCGPYMEDVSRTHRAKIEAKATAAIAIGRDASEAPGLTGDSAAIATDVREAALIYLEDFRELTELSKVYARILATRMFPDCVALVRTDHKAWNSRYPDTVPEQGFGNSAKKQLEACERMAHLLVIRTTAFAPPTEPERIESKALAGPAGSDGGAAKSGDAGADADAGQELIKFGFNGGYLEADVLVYALADARRLGGFRVEVENSDQVQSTLLESLELDLRENLEKKLSDSAKRLMPRIHIETPE